MNRKGFYSAVMGLIAVVIAGTIFLSAVPPAGTAPAGAIVMGVEDQKFMVVEFLLLADRAASDALADHLYEKAVDGGSCGSSDNAQFEAKLEGYFGGLSAGMGGICSLDTSQMSVNPFNENKIGVNKLGITCGASGKPNLTIIKSYSASFTPGEGLNPGICEIMVYDGEGASGMPEVALAKLV